MHIFMLTITFQTTLMVVTLCKRPFQAQSEKVNKKNDGF